MKVYHNSTEYDPNESALVLFGADADEEAMRRHIRNALHFVVADEEADAVYVPLPFLSLLDGAGSAAEVFQRARRKHVISFRVPKPGTPGAAIERFLMPLKYSIVSFLSFLIDYAVFLLLGLFPIPLWIRVYGARVVSATCNYFINRRYVFYGYTLLGILRHFAVVAASVTLNYLLLSLLVDVWGLPSALMKPLVDLLLFFFGFAGEKLFVFRKKELKHEIR
ncbi:MAG: GtrA family protein [Eubacteriales bacterium]|nr:GtrA family protein [Eubacteriales bacterium]